MVFFKDATAAALTTAVVGLAAIITQLPNISGGVAALAVVASLTRMLILARPGMVTVPVLSTSLVTYSVKHVNTLAQSFFSSFVAFARAVAKLVFMMLSMASFLARLRGAWVLAKPAFFVAVLGAMAGQAGEESELRGMLT